MHCLAPLPAVPRRRLKAHSATYRAPWELQVVSAQARGAWTWGPKGWPVSNSGSSINEPTKPKEGKSPLFP